MSVRPLAAFTAHNRLTTPTVVSLSYYLTFTLQHDGCFASTGVDSDCQSPGIASAMWNAAFRTFESHSTLPQPRKMGLLDEQI